MLSLSCWRFFNVFWLLACRSGSSWWQLEHSCIRCDGCVFLFVLFNAKNVLIIPQFDWRKKNVSQTCSGEMFSAAQLDFSFTMRWLKSLVTCAVDVLIQIFHVFRIYFPWKGDRYLTFACIHCIPFLFNSIFPSLFTSNRLRILLMVNNLLTFAGFQQSSHRTNDAFVIRLNVFCMLSFLYEFHAWNYLRN